MKYLLALLLSIQLFAALPAANNQDEQVKVYYPEMLEYMNNSNNDTQFAALGALYATGSTIKDDHGNIIKQDIFLAEKYLLKSGNMGNIRSLTMLANFIILNKEMRRLDPTLTKSEKYLKTAYAKGDLSACVILSNLYFQKNDGKNGLSTLTECAAKNNADAQLAMAILFKDNININGKPLVKTNVKTADFYLNKACNNSLKSDNVNSFCSKSGIVETIIKR
jgi:TPR repeat protein